MSAHNLAVVISPILAPRLESASEELVLDAKVTNFVEVFLEKLR